MLGVIRDSLKITAILDCKQQRSAAAYRDLRAEVRQKGFQKPNNGKLSNREIWWRNLCRSGDRCSRYRGNKPAKSLEHPQASWSDWTWQEKRRTITQWKHSHLAVVFYWHFENVTLRKFCNETPDKRLLWSPCMFTKTLLPWHFSPLSSRSTSIVPG